MSIFLQHLLRFLFQFTVLGFAAAPMAEISGGNDDSGELESSGEHAGEPTGGEGKEEPETTSEPSLVDGKTVDAAKAQEAKIDGRQLPPKVREVMEQLKAADPKAHGFLKDVLFRDRAYAKELPGGLAELKTLKETVAALPEGGLEAFKTSQAEWDAIDTAYNAADPKFLDIMVDANPQSFNKIAPMMVQKFAQTDPEGYQRHMAGLFVATLVNSGVPQSLRFLGKAVEMGDKENAAAILGELNELVKGWDATAKSQPKAPERNTELDAREQRIKDAEDKQWVDGTASTINTSKTSAIKKELAQHTKGQQIDDETYEAIEGQALKYLNSMLMADPNFSKTFNAYVESKDRDGVSRYIKSKLEELLPSKPGKPGPVEKAYKLFFRGASPKPVTKPGTPAKPAVAAPQGWVKLGKAPAPHEIDLNKSPWEMRFKQGAVLKTGKKVFWGANAPA